MATQPKIHDYGIVGDGRSVALISRDGSLDWLCWPRFDSAPVFARLLDLERGGSWKIAPTAAARTSRRYVDRTNILETTLEHAGGRGVLTDLMTIASEEDKRRMLVPDHEVLRCVRCERGTLELEVMLDPRPGFGRTRVRVEHHGQLGVRWHFGSRVVALRADVPLTLRDGVVRGIVRLRAGESAVFSLTFDDGPALVVPLGDAARERIERSRVWWTEWIARARYDGPYRDLVLRSALTLKLMAFAPSGAIVAAPTTSLPERIGADMNWDYRYCWPRDAAFAARAMLELGYREDAEAFCTWLLHTTRLTAPELRIMYDVYGRRPPRERALPGLAGYRDSQPVRVGNATFDQLQLDCYGEALDAAAHVARANGSLDRDTRKLLRELGDYVSAHWREPDHGIWEPRGRPEHRTHSRVLCWVALDRLLDLNACGLVDRVDRDHLARECAAIRADIETHAFDPRLGCYTSAFGNPDLDANVLLMTWYGFQPAGAPRMRSTFARVCERLGAGPGLFYRYDDSLRSREGAFWMCSFWAVEHLARGGGSLAEATALMNAACSYVSDLGLMAEEVDPATGDALGNFPQSFTHVGLIHAALSLEQCTAQVAHHPEPVRTAEVRR